jgi:hypothetical protein
MPDIATLGLKVDANGAIRELRNFDRALDTTAAKSEAFSKKLAVGFGVAAIGATVAAYRRVITETMEAQRVQAQLEAVVRSTGSAAGYTVGQLNEMSAALQKTTTFSDEAVTAAQSVLLAFTNIRGPEFQAAIDAVTNMSARLGGDLTSNARLVGRALEDPMRGMRGLTSAGIVFSESQREVIKNLVETGRLVEAQKILLRELEERYGGAAKAARDTMGGAVEGLKNAFGELFEETERNTRANTRLINSLTGILERMKEIREENQKRFFPDYSGVINGALNDLSGFRMPYSGRNTVIRASVTQAELEAAAEAKRAAAREALARATEAVAEKERLYADALRFSAEQAAKVLPLAVQIYKALYEQQRALQQSLGLATVGTDAVRDIKLRGGFDDLVDQKILDRFTKNVGELSEAAEFAARSISQAVEYMIVQKIGGGSITANLGAGVAKGALSTFAGGFGATALGGAIFGPIAAGVGAAFGSAIDSVFDFSGKAKQAAEALRQMEIAATANALAAKVAAQGFESLEQRQERETAAFRKNYDETRAALAKDGLSQADLAILASLISSHAKLMERLAAEDALLKEQEQAALEVRMLRAQGFDEEADALAFATAQRKEYTEALRAGATAEELAYIEEVQAAERTRRAADKAREAVEELWQKMEDFARATKQMEFGSSSRILTALGRTRESEDMQMGFNAQREMEDAIKAGMNPATLAMLALAHVLEREALMTQRAIEDQTKAVEKALSDELASLDRQMAAVKLISEVEQKAMDEQIEKLRKESKVQQQTMGEQLDVMRDQLSVSRDSLSVQSQSVRQTQAALDAIVKFADGLSLNPSLTTLSPIGQLAEARRQYEATLGLARGGDKTAAGNLPDIARSLLEASRGVNASGLGYVSDFLNVQQTLAEMRSQFGTQLSVEERILAELEAQHTTLEAQIKAVQEAREVASNNAAAQIEALQEAKQLAQEAAAAELESLQQAKEQARIAADAQIAALTTQLQESLKAYAESIKFYNEWKRMSDEMLGTNIRYFADMVDKLGKVIENTFRTANNLELWKQGPPPAVPDPIIPGIEFNTQQTVNELRVAVGVLSAGFTVVRQELAQVSHAIGENTTATRQGLEAVVVANRE